jgi:hypothetical protein
MYARRPRRKIPTWVILLAILLGVIAFLVILAGLYLFKPETVTASQPTAILTVVNAPTATPLGSQGLFDTPTPTPTISGVVIDGIGLGVYVQISGTGGDGLRLRSSPGVDSPTLFLGNESEAFKVTDGPQMVDGYTWWFLTAPYDENRSGWAVSDYLSVVQLPTSQP